MRVPVVDWSEATQQFEIFAWSVVDTHALRVAKLDEVPTLVPHENFADRHPRIARWLGLRPARVEPIDVWTKEFVLQKYVWFNRGEPMEWYIYQPRLITFAQETLRRLRKETERCLSAGGRG